MRIGAGFFLLAFPFLCAAEQAQEPSVAREAGRAVYEFGQGVGHAALQPLADNAQRLRGEWITVNPRPVADCLEETDGVINPTFARCRNGWQEHVVYERDGRKRVLRERPIPMQ